MVDAVSDAFAADAAQLEEFMRERIKNEQRQPPPPRFRTETDRDLFQE